MHVVQIDRASSDDMVSLATDVGAAPMQVGAVILLDTSEGFDLERARRTIDERIRSVPRLRQRLVATPFGCGRPIWVDDADFDLDRHVDHVRCPPPGDEDAVLAVAATAINDRMPPDRPLWRLRFVTDVDGGRTALIVAFHHVLADGIGGLAVLANLVDGAPPMPTDPPLAFPRPPPPHRLLATEAARTRIVAVTRLPATLRRVRAAIVQLRSGRATDAPRCSLQQPTGPHRRYAVVRADLDDLLAVARRHGATVNDVVLTTVAAALRTLLASRGESVDRFVMSVPVSARRTARADHLGNAVGVVPVEIPASGTPTERLREVAAITRKAKGTASDASTAVLGPVFRVLAKVGLFHWFVDRQHLVHTFVTNLRGPDAELSIMGAPITEVVAAAVVTGNVSVAFAVLSYAGMLGITVIADPDACPDLDVLRDALQIRARRAHRPRRPLSRAARRADQSALPTEALDGSSDRRLYSTGGNTGNRRIRLVALRGWRDHDRVTSTTQPPARNPEP